MVVLSSGAKFLSSASSSNQKSFQKAIKKATQMSDLCLPMYLQHQSNTGADLKPEKRNSDTPIPASGMQNAALLHKS
ncbi:MAG: hypothetical protein ACQEXV_16605 [Bacillota bacterium]